MKTLSTTNSINRSPLRYVLFLIPLLFALLVMPGTVRGQMFVFVNANPFSNGGCFIYQYDPTGSTGTPTTFLSNLDHPRGLAFDSFGKLFVATTTFGFDADDNIVSYQGAVLKVSGGVASTFATFTDGFAEGLATDSAGNLFVSSQKFDDTESTIYKVTPGGTVSSFGSVPGQCFGLTFDSAGNLFVAGADPTLTYGTIYKFTPEGAPYEPTPTGTPGVFVGAEAFSSSPGPIDLAFDAHGNLFASVSDGSSSNSGIRRFDPDGNEITPQFATGLTRNPRGLRFDSDGNLFLAEPGIGGTNPPLSVIS
jgi:sugar lactone lactonase YvrE